MVCTKPPPYNYTITKFEQMKYQNFKWYCRTTYFKVHLNCCITLLVKYNSLIKHITHRPSHNFQILLFLQTIPWTSIRFPRHIILPTNNIPTHDCSLIAKCLLHLLTTVKSVKKYFIFCEDFSPKIQKPDRVASRNGSQKMIAYYLTIHFRIEFPF